jgi:C-terminal processing protease CtpA/Prc
MKKLLVLLLSFLSSTLSFAQTILKAEDLQKDFAIMRQSYEQHHPGLYKYNSKEVIDSAFETCKAALNKDQTLAEAYLTIHKLTASFKCGHAYPNFFNQEDFLKKELFEGKNTLPFHFRLISDRMLVTKSVDEKITEGVEIKKINGIKIEEIIKTLLPIIRADGSNDGKRKNLLELNGQQYFEYFDIFFPMFFPLKSDQFALETYDFKTKKKAKITVSAKNHTERNNLIKTKYPLSNYVKTKFEWLNNKTAILTINDFMNFKNNYSYDSVYQYCLKEYKQKGGQNLIIDVRKNEGGNGSEMFKLVQYLIKTPIEHVELQNTWQTLKIDPALKPYVDNKKWAFPWFSQSEKGYNKTTMGQWKGKGADKAQVIEPKKEGFNGNIYLLSSPTNSSATYMMVEIFKKHKLATVVGQTTGGNQKGVTAGALYFMLLPNSKIEVDVPLIGTDLEIAKNLPDAGVEPDFFVKPSIEDAVKGIDTEMEVVKKMISKLKNK